MKNIGVVLPYTRGSDNFVKEFLKKFKYKKIPVTEYGFNFVVVHDNQNCSKIFNKNKVNSIVLMTSAEIQKCNFRIINGDRAYLRMLPDFVRKIAKSHGDSCSVTVIDRSMSEHGAALADKLCNICRTVNISTGNAESAGEICDRLFDKYGVVINILNKDSIVDTDIAVVVEDCGNEYGQKCVVIDKKRKRCSDRIINDFYIPFRIKPPLGISNLIFAECVDEVNTKVVDI